VSTQFSTAYLLVDGYNIIHAWKKLKAMAEVSLISAREMLVDILANYRGYKHQEIIVVFDAHRVEGGTGAVEKRNGVYIVYTREAETADEYIEKTTGQLRRERIRVRVATSDHLEQIIIMGQGAARLFAEDLQREVNEVERIIRDRINKPKPIKKNMLYENLDPETAAAIEKMRMESM
jgi:predicted RNA-binding protein with PIN domain